MPGSRHSHSSLASTLLGLLLAGTSVVGCATGNTDEQVTEPGGDSAGGEGGDGAGDGVTGDTGVATEGGGDSGGDAASESSGDTDDGSSSESSTEGGVDAGDDGDGAPADTGPDDTGSADTGSPDTGPADTGTDTAPPPDTGPDPCGSSSCSIDSDGDGIPDAVEGRCASGGATDTDKDGTPDYLDLDSDNDTIPDKVEWAAGGCDPTAPLNDADGDGTPNFRDTDSDNNGLLDKDERCPPAAVLTALGKPACAVGTAYDFDGDGLPDFLDPDNDHDSKSTSLDVGLEDKYELTDITGKYVGLIDTDGDGIPDVYDRDSDNDTIADLDDGLADTDKDGKQNFRDTDSDGDGVPDKCEARGKASPPPSDISLPVVDTDGDGKPDYLDLDSDGDLLTDGLEDKNFNCVVDACETNRLKKDTDGDGVDDLVEKTLDTGGACWASDATMTPAKAGKFYFLEPYSTDGSAKPTPTSSTLALTTDLQKGDLGFVVDTSYSMNGEFTNLKTSLSSIIDSLKTKLPDLGIGIAGHDDIPTAKSTSSTNLYGSCDNTPYVGGLPVSDDAYYQLTAVTTDKTTAVTAVSGLRMANGQDLPEDQVVAMHYAFTGIGFSWPSVNGCPAGSKPTVADTVTNYGTMRFRVGALPMIMSISDAQFHNGYHTTATMPVYTGVVSTSWCTYDPGSAGPCKYYLDPVLAYPGGWGMPTISTLATALKAKGARFLGGAADDSRGAKSPGGTVYTSGPSAGVAGTSAARNTAWNLGAYGDMAYLADQTGSIVPPSAFTHGVSCPVGQCCTGFDGAGVPPDAPDGVSCRLVFNVRHDGTGLGTQVVDAVVALLKAIKFDVYVQASPTVGEAVDSVDNFMTAIQPSPTGGTDPVTGGVCVTFPGTSVADKYHTPKALAGAGDINETITGVTPGPLYCFNVIPKTNTTVPATSVAQLYHATLRVYAENGSGKIALGTDREVLFIVPPLSN